MTIESALIAINKNLHASSASTASVDNRPSNTVVPVLDSDGKPWSNNIDKMASMNRDLRKSRACYLRCLAEFGFPVSQSGGTVEV